MQRSSLYKSIGLHLAALLVLVIDLPEFKSQKLEIGQAPIIVDLSEVKISEMTNLPPKAEFAEKTQKATAQKKIETYTKEEQISESEEIAEKKESNNSFLEAPKPAEKPKTPEPKKMPKPMPPKPAQKPKPPAQPKPKPEPKKEDKTPPVQPKSQPKQEPKKELANPLKSLMDSVDELKAEAAERTQKATIAEGTKVQNMGVEGGKDGSYFQELSITETDLIASRLRECWNLDPGAMGLQNMIIEIRAHLNQDGTVRDVQILDSSRYNSDTRFRAIAESARRAVYTCQPYSIFAEKYGNRYDIWKTLKLRFNPMDGAVN